MIIRGAEDHCFGANENDLLDPIAPSADNNCSKSPEIECVDDLTSECRQKPAGSVAEDLDGGVRPPSLAKIGPKETSTKTSNEFVVSGNDCCAHTEGESRADGGGVAGSVSNYTEERQIQVAVMHPEAPVRPVGKAIPAPRPE
eukprot:scaffold27431_cov20-Prasinocladus_malaysianus.AAC.1